MTAEGARDSLGASHFPFRSGCLEGGRGGLDFWQERLLHTDTACTLMEGNAFFLIFTGQQAQQEPDIAISILLLQLSSVGT